MNDARILLVDDNEQYLEVYSKILCHNGHDVNCACNGKNALEILKRQEMDIVVTDMVMPGMDGLELIEEAIKIQNGIQVIVVTGEGTVPNAVEAMKIGAYTYMQKPLNVEGLLAELEKMVEIIHLKRINESLRFQYESTTEVLVGESRFTESIRETIQQVSQYDTNILITGESGTGKEVVAGLIHEHSRRREFPMIRVNCAAFADGVMESELFGHEKGAFTGAEAMKKGRFELANGSTLFLDEIGELTPSVQVKLLRTIQEKYIERVGGHSPIKTDFRLIAATNRNLKAEILRGTFREDLYYRINVIPIHLAPLREHHEDIQTLIRYFSQQYSIEMSKPPIRLSVDAMQIMMNYSWPGNTRELKNIIERLTVFSSGKSISASELPKEISLSSGEWHAAQNIRDVMYGYEKRFLMEKLTKNNWNISLTSQEIGLARKNLHAKIKQHGLSKYVVD